MPKFCIDWTVPIYRRCIIEADTIDDAIAFVKTSDELIDDGGGEEGDAGDYEIRPYLADLEVPADVDGIDPWEDGCVSRPPFIYWPEEYRARRKA